MDEEIRVKVEGRGCGRPLGDEIQQVGTGGRQDI
jgi:hypothetical protein